MPICGGNVIIMVHIPICAFRGIRLLFLQRTVCKGRDSASDVAQNAQTTAGTLSLPSARSGA